MSETQGREDSRLEIDDDMHCQKCGVALPIEKMTLYDIERCPDCYLEYHRNRVENIFGSTKTSDVWLGFKDDPEGSHPFDGFVTGINTIKGQDDD